MAWLTDTDAPGAGRGSVTSPSPTALSPYARRGRLAARKSIPGRCRVAAWSAAVLRSQRSRLSPSSRLPCPPGSREIVLSMRSNLPDLESEVNKLEDLAHPWVGQDPMHCGGLGTNPERCGETRMGAVPELSTTDLVVWSPRWESNPRPTPYQGVALPLSHLGRVTEPGDGTRWPPTARRLIRPRSAKTSASTPPGFSESDDRARLRNEYRGWRPVRLSMRRSQSDQWPGRRCPQAPRSSPRTHLRSGDGREPRCRAARP